MLLLDIEKGKLLVRVGRKATGASHFCSGKLSRKRGCVKRRAKYESIAGLPIKG